MLKDPKQFKNKRPNFDKLKSYGFNCDNGIHEYTEKFLNGAFSLNLKINSNGESFVKITDEAISEEYSLAYVEGATGAFVGEIRKKADGILLNIADNCFEQNVFRSVLAKEIIDYILKKYGDCAEYLWDKFPNNAIFREKSKNKWYAALLSVEGKKIGASSEEVIEIIDLKALPEEIKDLVDGEKYLEGYHMNKKHWYTVKLDGSVPAKEIFERIDNSYKTVKERK